MISSLLSTESRKAWVAGLLATLLNPVLSALSGSNVLTVRVLVVAVITGALSAVAVWATTNVPAATPASSAPVTAADPVEERPAAITPGPSPLHPTVSALEAAATEDFGGQTVEG